MVLPILGVVLAAVAAFLAYFVFASFAFGAGYQPTPRASSLEMLRLARLSPEDVLYDLGAGTGALVFRAARRYGVRVVGVEVEPLRVLILVLRRALGASASLVTIRWGNLFGLDLREATVVATFLWPGAMARLRPKLEAQLRPGARLVSHCHPMPGWTAAAHDSRTDVYLYEWPAARASAPASATGDA